MALVRACLIIFISACCYNAVAKDISVTQYGAVGDGVVLNTMAIQKAIDHCSVQGGGRVVFPQGIWLSGTIFLKDNVTLVLDEKAVLSGSTNIADYQLVDEFKDGRGSSMGYCFIGAKDVKNIAITGKGKIDGNGAILLGKNGRSKRPFLLRLVRCTGVKISDVTMQEPAAWTAHFFECKDVLAERVTIRSRGLGNNDGFDIDCCDGVTIKNCDIDSGDDAICLKTTGSKACKNIVVIGCKINTGQGAFKMGTESVGNFGNITVKNCVVKQCKGIKLYSVDGSNIRNLSISNIRIAKTTLPIMLRLGARLKTFREGDIKKPAGTFQNVRIKNIIIDTATQMAILISGIPDHNIRDVKISGIKVRLPGAGNAADAKTILAENETDYPETSMFGKSMPSYGLYVRHAENVSIKNINIALAQSDARPAIVGIDVNNVDLKKWVMPAPNSAGPLISLENAQKIRINKMLPDQKPGAFLYVSGANSKNIVLRASSPVIRYGLEANKRSVTIK